MDLTPPRFCFYLKSLALAMALCIHSISASEQADHLERKIIIGTSEIVGKLTKERNSTGFYDRFLSQLDNVELVFVPYSRFDALIADGTVDCLFPESITTTSNPEQFIQSDALSTVQAFIFSKMPYQSHQEFEGSGVSIRRGLSYGGVRQKLAANYVELGSDEALVKFLELGRVDAFIAYLSDVSEVYKNLNITTHFYLPTLPIYEAKEAFVCNNTNRNAAFIIKVNSQIKRFLSEN